MMPRPVRSRKFSIGWGRNRQKLLFIVGGRGSGDETETEGMDWSREAGTGPADSRRRPNAGDNRKAQAARGLSKTHGVDHESGNQKEEWALWTCLTPPRARLFFSRGKHMPALGHRRILGDRQEWWRCWMQIWPVFARTATTSTATGDCFGRGCPTGNASSLRGAWPKSRRHWTLWPARHSRSHSPARREARFRELGSRAMSDLSGRIAA